MASYAHAAGVEPRAHAERPLLSTADGGYIAIDDGLLALWRAAAGRTLEELTRAAPHAAVDGIQAEALACLAEAGALTRSPHTPRPEPPPRSVDARHTVTAIIVVSVPAELVWLEPCVRALMAQHHALERILVVDNAVGIDMSAWLRTRGLNAHVHSLMPRTNFARALNAGFRAAPASEFLLFMNADMKVHESCVGNLVSRALATPGCAAAAPKLLFWRAPAFLNGIGNRVPGWGFGTDNGIGQLDLGQLDDWTDIPSGCLGNVLISRAALEDVGPFDVNYPLYYEDTDWSFRARLQGYRVVAAPDAQALHAFGGSWDEGAPTSLSSAKLGNALLGQLRFAVKVPSPGRSALLLMHAFNDWGINIRGALRTRDTQTIGAYARTAVKTAVALPSLTLSRLRIQSRRAVPDATLFAHADDLTPSMVWWNLPELTCANIRAYYAPLIRSGRTRPLPEIISARI
jgi:GT2 family glycosyltransferase